MTNVGFHSWFVGYKHRIGSVGSVLPANPAAVLCRTAQLRYGEQVNLAASKKENKTMRFLTTIATLTVLLAPVVTFNPSIAQAESAFTIFKVQSNAQFLSRNSSQRRSGAASNSLSGGVNGTERVCCTGYTHKGGYSGCATFDATSCPTFARYTPPPA